MNDWSRYLASPRNFGLGTNRPLGDLAGPQLFAANLFLGSPQHSVEEALSFLGRWHSTAHALSHQLVTIPRDEVVGAVAKRLRHKKEDAGKAPGQTQVLGEVQDGGSFRKDLIAIEDDESLKIRFRPAVPFE